MPTTIEYQELADEADRVAPLFNDLLGHAANYNVSLPQVLYDANPVLIGLPRQLREQAAVRDLGAGPEPGPERSAGPGWFEDKEDR